MERLNHLMTLVACAITFSMLALFSPLQASAQEKPEQISVAYCGDCTPFQFTDENGDPAGIIIDHWNLWSKNTGIEIEYIAAPWNDTLRIVSEGTADVHAGLFFSEERDKTLDYGVTLTRTNTQAFFHRDLPFIRGINDLTAYRIGVLSGDYLEGYLKETTPEANVVRLPNYDSIMEALKERRLRVFAADTETALHYLRRDALEAEFPLSNSQLLYQNDWRVAVSEGKAELLEVIAAGMATIGEADKQKIGQRWGSSSLGADKNTILSTAEQQWINDHPVLRLGVDPAWPPLDFLDENGLHLGFAADILRLLGQRLGLSIEMQRGLSWPEVLEGARERRIDIVSLCAETPDRREFLRFTRPILTIPWVISTRKDFRSINSLGDLEDGRVAISSDYFINSLARNEFPNMSILEVDSPLAGLQAVELGEADAYVDSLGVISYLLRENGLNNLKIAADSGFPQEALHICVRSDWPELLTVLNKGLEDLPPDAVRAIQRKWVPSQLSDIATPNEDSSESFVIWVGAGTFVAFVALFLAVRLLMRNVADEKVALQFGSRRFRASVISFLAFFVAIVVLLGWFAMEHNKQSILASIRTNLQTVLTTTMERLDDWVIFRKTLLTDFAEDPELLAIVEDLVDVPSDRASLMSSLAFLKARSYFDQLTHEFGTLGFYIVSVEGVSIGSESDLNVGTRNIIAKQRPVLFQRAVQGEITLIPPVRSDTAREKGGTAEGNATMYFAAPIRSANGKVIAVLAQRIDPAQDFTRVLQFGRIGESGESYAFDRNGLLMSESRFDSELQKIGLIGSDQQSMLNVYIRDPGGNMVEGFDPTTTKQERPYTRMARAAVQGKPGIDLEGYRDYRGVPVLGAWTWNATLDLGITTEIDVAEALAPFYTMRSTVVGVLIFTLLFSVSAVFFTLTLGENANRALARARNELEERVVERTQELQESEQRVTTILENTADGIIVIDESGVIQTFSSSAARIFGYAPKDVLGQNITLLMPERIGQEHDNYIKKYLGGGEPKVVGRNRETVGLRSDGTEFPMDLAVGKAYLAGNLIFVGIVRDITDRKLAEEELLIARDAAEEATKAKAAFLAAMSHEIRTPMGGVIGMVDLLQQTSLDEDQLHMTQTVRNSASALLTIINDILDFSKIEAGKLDLESIPISVLDCVEGVAEALSISARDKGVSLNVYVDPDIPDAVFGDQVRLRQVLFNLGGNAVKFTESGRVFIRADRQPKSGADTVTVRFEVTDDGIGISDEAQEYLFTAFSQAESSTTRRFGGTGLGLSICQRLTELMQGEIGVESTVGVGSTFHVTLSFPVAKQHTIKSEGEDLSDLSVLLAVQSDELRGLMPRYLERWGATVTCVSDISELETVTKDTAYDVVGLISKADLEHQIEFVEHLNGLNLAAAKRFIIACWDRDRSKRRPIDNTLYIDANPLMRARLIRAVAAAAGRVSPEISYDEKEIPAKPRKAPSVENAEAAGQLILIAEDNPTNQDVIGRQLNLLGYAFEVANDGNEALEMFRKKRFAILLTDCHMPNMDGFELSKAIRESESDLENRFPIVAITASVMKEEIDACFAAGMDDYLAKPLEMPKLRDMLRKRMPNPIGEIEAEPSEIPAATLEQTPKESSKNPIDPSALESIFGDDEATIREVLTDFVEPAASIVEEIQAAFEERSSGGIARAAHKLKSSARSVGAVELADLCATLEEAGTAESWDEIDATAPKLADTLLEVTDYISRQS